MCWLLEVAVDNHTVITYTMRSLSLSLTWVILLFSPLVNIPYATATPIPSELDNLNITGIIDAISAFYTKDEITNTIDNHQSLTKRAIVSNTAIPTVDELASEITAKGVVPQMKSCFYTRMSPKTSSCWAKKHTEYFPVLNPTCSALSCGLIKKKPSDVFYNDIMGSDTAVWMEKYARAVMAEGAANGQPWNGRGCPIDVMQTRMSQAFAQAAIGDVYWFTENGHKQTRESQYHASLIITWSLSNQTFVATWYGWEYPALTRNSKVTNIYRVDPTDDDFVPVRIWKKGNGPTSREPRGDEEPLQPGVDYSSTTIAATYASDLFSADPTGPV